MQLSTGKQKTLTYPKFCGALETQNQNENFNSSSQDHNLKGVADKKLIKETKEVLEGKKTSLKLNKVIKNTG